MPTDFRYFVLYPRDFANEYTVYVVAFDRTADFRRAFPGAERIPRREAIRLGFSRPRQAKKSGEQWYGGFAGEVASSQSEAIEACKAATIEAMTEHSLA